MKPSDVRRMPEGRPKGAPPPAGHRRCTPGDIQRLTVRKLVQVRSGARATLAEVVARHPRPVIALHALTPGPADPSIFGDVHACATLLALGPGWDPHHLSARVSRVNDLPAACARISDLVTESVT